MDISAAEKLLEDDSFVVFGVPGAIEQGGGAFGDGLFQESQLWAVAFEFGLISCFEFRPFSGIVSEPFSEFIARCNFFEP